MTGILETSDIYSSAKYFSCHLVWYIYESNEWDKLDLTMFEFHCSIFPFWSCFDSLGMLCGLPPTGKSTKWHLLMNCPGREMNSHLPLACVGTRTGVPQTAQGYWDSTLLSVFNMCSVNKVSLSNVEGNKATQSFSQVIYLKTSITVSTSQMIAPAGKTDFWRLQRSTNLISFFSV